MMCAKNLLEKLSNQVLIVPLWHRVEVVTLTDGSLYDENHQYYHILMYVRQ